MLCVGAPLQAKAVKTYRDRYVSVQEAAPGRGGLGVRSAAWQACALAQAQVPGLYSTSQQDVGSISSPPSRRGPEAAPAGASRRAVCIQSNTSGRIRRAYTKNNSICGLQYSTLPNSPAERLGGVPVPASTTCTSTRHEQAFDRRVPVHDAVVTPALTR